MNLIFILFIGAFSFSAIGENSIPFTLANFQTVSQCMNRVWPGTSFQGHNVLLVNENLEQQWALNMDTGETFRLSLDELENGRSAKAAYSYFESNGRSWLSLNEKILSRPNDPYDVFATGAHEFFHFIGQRNWKVKPRGFRGTFLPIRWEPRYYRAMMQKNLRMALVSSGEEASQHLSRAKYWDQLWRAEFPEEVLSSTDDFEGSARYVEVLSTALASQGCRAEEGDLLEFARSWSRKDLDLSQTLGFFGLDVEGYSLGALSGFLLRWTSPISKWEDRVAEGETPVEILLQQSSPEEEAMDQDLAEKFEQSAIQLQIHADSMLAESRDTLRSEDLVYVSFPRGWKPGSTSFAGFYVERDQSFGYGVIRQDLAFQSGDSRVESQKGLVQIFMSRPSPCSFQGWVFPVRESQIEISELSVQVQTSKLNGHFKGERQWGSDGTLWICGKD